MGLPISLCDACRSPGHCCKGFSLTEGGEERTFWVDEGDAPVLKMLADNALPFVIGNETGRYSDVDGRKYRSLVFSCPHLRGGRCSIYKDRPALCKSFAAGSGPLCVMYVPPEESPAKCGAEGCSKEP